MLVSESVVILTSGAARTEPSANARAGRRQHIGGEDFWVKVVGNLIDLFARLTAKENSRAS
jgi:hypothetical protein